MENLFVSTFRQLSLTHQEILKCDDFSDLMESKDKNLIGIFQLCLHAAIAVWDPILCYKILSSCFDNF